MKAGDIIVIRVVENGWVIEPPFRMLGSSDTTGMYAFQTLGAASTSNQTLLGFIQKQLEDTGKEDAK